MDLFTDDNVTYATDASHGVGYLLYELKYSSRLARRAWSDAAHVRFGSLADICDAIGDVRFTPDRSRRAPMVMSALHPKADMCGATAYVCFGPIADIR